MLPHREPLKNIFKLKKKSTIGKESASNAGDLGLNSRWEGPLKKEMTTRFNILAWRISWTEEPGRLQSMGLQRIGHN